MIQKVKESSVYNTNIDQFVVDEATDINNLPKNCVMGSLAFCIENKKFYMIDSTGTWNEI